MLRWFWLGTLFFLSIPAIVFYEQRIYDRNEPAYGSPIAALSYRLQIRSDAYGKGYFGASRNGRRTHAGLDLESPVGNPVLASKSGRVYFSGDDAGYGHYVELHHPDGLSTRYAHLSAIEVSEGTWVSQGQTIGRSGRSGNATHPSIRAHLHFEIRYKDQALNPTQGLLDPKIHLQY